MRVHEASLRGLLLLEPDAHHDARGFLVETYRASVYGELLPSMQFVQENHSRSVRGTIRGLHYQQPPGQAKLVRVARGRIWDVAVDLRADSPTFGKYESFYLDDVSHRQLYIPRGFAHGFCSLTDPADVVYKLDTYYVPSAERGIVWDDQEIGVDWPVANALVSDRDRALPPWREVRATMPSSWDNTDSAA